MVKNNILKTYHCNGKVQFIKEMCIEKLSSSKKDFDDSVHLFKNRAPVNKKIQFIQETCIEKIPSSIKPTDFEGGIRIFNKHNKDS